MTPPPAATPYDAGFYANLETGTRASAEVIVPLLLTLVPARSVVDVGCGLGIWLAAFAANGVTDFHGFDGPYVDPSSLHIPRERFTPVDLNQPLSVGRRYDLALSLEVAEHLQPGRGDGHVDQLTRLAPVVLFSAAVPGQGGTGHVNEQWPEYWAERFAARNYRAVDAIRPQLARSSARVDFWYTQNILVYVEASRLSSYPQLGPSAAVTRADSLAWAHPTLYESVREELAAAEARAAHWSKQANSARRSIARLPGLIWRAARRRVPWP